MPTCKGCQDEVAKVVAVKVDGKTVRLCADCADRAREAAEIGAESERVMQGMMGYRGRG